MDRSSITRVYLYLTYVEISKLDAVDEMTCWKTDECPVDDPSKFTKAWKVRSAEKNPTMETHFDSEVGGYFTPFS